jgi:hypothetical protein
MSATLKFVILDMPDSPLSKRSQLARAPLAKGVTIPSPVTTTRLMGPFRASASEVQSL